MFNLMIARKKKKMTQEELGSAVGVERQMINRYENDKSKPTVEVLMKLAAELEVTTDYLLGLEG